MAGALVIAGNGRLFTSASIGSAVATRAIIADLRAGIGQKNMDSIQGGPAPFSKADRSRFLQALDEALVRMGDGGMLAIIRPNGTVKISNYAKCLIKIGKILYFAG